MIKCKFKIIGDGIFEDTLICESIEQFMSLLAKYLTKDTEKVIINISYETELIPSKSKN